MLRNFGRAAYGLLILTRPLLQGPSRRLFLALLAGIAAVLLLETGLSLLANRWNKWFFDTLEAKAVDQFVYLGLIFAAIAAGTAMASGASIWLRTRTQILWRTDLTARLVERWIVDDTFYRMTVMRSATDLPEHRIAEDVRLAVEPVVDLTAGFVTSLLTLLAFSSVLWIVGGSLHIGWFELPGFMFFAALGYAAIVTTVMLVTGRSLTTRLKARSESEAAFRYALTRVKDNAEPIALLDAGPAESRRLGDLIGAVGQRWRDYARTWAGLTFVLASHNMAAPVVPILLMAPKYLAGEVTLGTVMQVAAAFGTVQGAAGWLTTNFATLSQWYAAALRVEELVESMQQSKDQEQLHSRIVVAESPDKSVRLEWLAVDLDTGERLIADAHVSLEPGEMVLIEGASGSGKSTLLRAMAGIWPWGSGTVHMPAGARVRFLPQRPYVPQGSLKAAICYPDPPDSFSDEIVLAALDEVGLHDLAPYLASGEELPWDRKLSGGELQRLSFARVLISRPDVVFLDEATSALDDANQARLMELFLTRLFSTTVISVAHRATLAKYHTKRLYLKRDEQHATMASREESRDPSWQSMRNALKRMARDEIEKAGSRRSGTLR